MNVLPSTSVIVDPRASAATTGVCTASGLATARASRFRISRARGPGISVRSSITLVVATDGAYAARRTASACILCDVELQDLDPDPVATLRDWLQEAEHTPLSHAMTLATATAAGRPSARMVLLR